MGSITSIPCEPAEVGVMRTYPLNAVFAHEDCRVQVVHEIAGGVWSLIDNLPNKLRVDGSRDEHRETPRLDQFIDEVQSSRRAERPPQHTGMGHNP